MVRQIGLRALLILAVLRTGFSKAVHVITVIVGDNPLLSYVTQSPSYDVAFSRAVGLFPSALQNVTRQTVYRPGAFSCLEAAEIMPFVAVQISNILDEHRFDFNVLISSGCSFEVMTLGDYAREWNVPLLATIAIDQSLTNAQRYPTVVAFPSSDQVTMIQAIMSLLDRFSWTTISLICMDQNRKVSDGGLYYFTACRGFLTVLGGQNDKYNLNVQHLDPKVKEGDLDAYSGVLRNAATQSRVIILLIPTNSKLRDFMINAERLGMTEGDFIFIAPRSPMVPTESTLDQQSRNGSSRAADSAFQSLILVNNPTPNWAALSGVLQSIRNTSEVRYNKTLTNFEMLNDLTISAFEVMTILLQVVRDLSPLEIEMQNGITFRQLFLNRTFNPLSRPVYIGPKGMRICDVHISKFNVTSGLMELSEEYLSVAGNSVRTHALSTVWRGKNGPPVNRPFCGYTGELCLGGLAKTAVIILAVSISTALLATLAIFIAMYHCIFKRSGHGAGRPWWDLRPDLLFVILKTTDWESL
ncbi:hypothetical protein BV898_19178 [Hypsibius exemplaris]|uniref:Receptor ligand binding region domain-containing protein n=1 Tax=Hypsibius exemplaris TaxID=2072580 RepID=A0A9X6RNP3_HYPEX|nr:hypothetical protein BV898_19178 [Hypsibius exemplaris]